MRAIAPDTGAPTRVIAEEQEQYKPLPVATYRDGREVRRVTAWVPTTQELDAMAQTLCARLGRNTMLRECLTEAHAKALLLALFRALPIHVAQLSFDNAAMTPLSVSVGAEDWMRVPCPYEWREPKVDVTGDESAALGYTATPCRLLNGHDGDHDFTPSPS